MSRYGPSPLGLLGLVAVGVAVIVSLTGVPITSAQGLTLFPTRVDGPLPADAPFDPAWDAIAPVDVALSGQPVTQPMRLEPAFPAVRVRSLEDGRRIAVMLEWDDATVDDSVLAVDHFADAAAIQLAMGDGTSICMGQQAGGLNIWHWKADWAVDQAAYRDVEDVHPNMPTDPHFPVPEGDELLGADGFLAGQAAANPRSAATRPSSVEDLNAIGFGTLTPQLPEGQNVQGASEHRGGTWRVVMSRDLRVDDPNDTDLHRGNNATAVAFAIWDGGRGDRNGLKSVSAWLALALREEPTSLLDMWMFLGLLAAALVLAGLLLWYGSRQPAIGLGWPPGGPAHNGDE